MRLSSSDQEIVRTKPQYTRLNLFIYQPQEVLRCRLSSPSIAKGAITIPVDNASSTGTVPFVNGMTMLVSNQDYGQDDAGRIRVRSGSISAGLSGSFSVAENSHINWQDDMYLTVVDYQDIVPVYPRIIQNPSNGEDVIFYKDYNVAYTDQNEHLGTIINMGGHRARVLENGSATIFWSASGTVNLDSEPISYAWSFGGGTPSTAVVATPGNVTYDTPGDYVTSLTVHATNTEYTSYRYVSIRDKIGEGSNTPYVRWEMSNFGGSRGEGGYSAEFTVWDAMDIKGNSLVMLTADDWYGATHQSYGGNTHYDPTMFFVGYIDSDSIQYDWKQSKVKFSVMSVTGIMKEAVGFSVSVESKASPNTWYELYEMDCRRAIYHYLRWHTTVLNTTDFIFNGEDKLIQFFDSDRTSMFDAIDELMRSALVGNVCADRQGSLYAEIEPMAYDNPTGTFGNYVMDITRRDWIDEPDVEERISDEVSYMERGGVKFKGVTTNTFQALLACAPGVTPSYRGSPNKEQGLALKSQTQLNTMIGHIFANMNWRYPTISMDMSENLRNLDIAPFETVNINIAEEDTVRGVNIHGLYIPDTINWTYDHKNGLHLPQIEYKSLVNGFPGDTILIPPAIGEGSPSFPKLDFTPIAIPPVLAMFSGTYPAGSDPTTVVIATNTHGVLYTTNFDEIAPVWQEMNDGLPSGTAGTTSIGDIKVCPNGSLFLMCNGDATFGYNSIYYAPAVGEAWSLVQESNPLDYTIGVFLGIATNPTSEEEVAVIGGLPTNTGEQGTILIGDGSGLSPSSDHFWRKLNYQSYITYMGGNWYIFTTTSAGIGGGGAQGTIHKYSSDGSSHTSKTGTPWVANPRYFGTTSTDKILYWMDSNMGWIYECTGDIENVIAYQSINLLSVQSASVSTDGLRLLGANWDGATYYQAYRSDDGAQTWDIATAVIPLMNSVFENCRDEKRWIFGGGGGYAGGIQIKYTSNFAEPGFNENKEGNLHPDFTGAHLTHIRFVA